MRLWYSGRKETGTVFWALTFRRLRSHLADIQGVSKFLGSI